MLTVSEFTEEAGVLLYVGGVGGVGGVGEGGVGGVGGGGGGKTSSCESSSKTYVSLYLCLCLLQQAPQTGNKEVRKPSLLLLMGQHAGHIPLVQMKHAAP